MSRLLFALLFLLPQQPLPVDDLIRRVSDTYGRLKDFEADIEQIQEFSSNHKEHLRGHVYLKSERKARFNYEYPRKWSEVFDGKTHTLFEPEINQATQQAIGKADEEYLTILQIVGNRAAPWKDQFREKQELKQTPLKPGDRVVKLLPKNKNLKDVLVEVDPGNFMIHRLVFTYAGGEKNEFRFSDIKTAPLDPALFVFKPLPGVKVRKQ
jgi:chaperone LolA